jgi:integrase/recombinase XerD
MKNVVKIRFVFRRAFEYAKTTPKKAQDGYLICYLTQDGQRAKFTLSLPKIAYAEWSPPRQCMLGNSPLAAATNRALTKVKADLVDIQADLERQQRPVTPKAIKQLYQNDGNSALSLLGIYHAFNEERKPLVGIEISAATQEIAEVRYNKLALFLESRKDSGMRPEEFRHNVGDQYLHWLLITQGFTRNTANKYLQIVAQVLTWAVRREHISKNPLAGYQFKMTAPKDITYLEAEELKEISCFVFQCWTGLAYADLAALDVAKCVEARNGRRILRIRRAKSTTFKGYECVIPLLPEAERILSHYEDKLPVFTNQYYNRAIRQLAMMCGIEGKTVTSHIGRKTAGVLFLNAGIPMEVVSKILGHSSVTQTEKVYAKILDRTVVDAIDKAFGSVNTPAPGYDVEPVAVEEARVIQFRFGA